MATIKISGSSDDIVVIDGDAQDECYPSDTESFAVVASDGTVLTGSYNGFWRFNRLVAGTAEYSKHEGTDEDTDYSDIVTLTGDIKWVAVAAHLAKVK